MDVQLHRLDLLQCGALQPGTLEVLPVGKKKQQKIAVGDDSGVLQVFYLKKGEVQYEWKSPALGREISSVVMQMAKDKIFVGCGQSIHGFTRKGKEFVKIKTNLTETIHHLFVEENMIWTGGEYILNIYDNCKDYGFVMTKDRINDLTCAPVYPGEILSTIVACQDKCLRVFQGEKVFHEFAVEGSATALGFHGLSPVDNPAHHVGDPVQMIYGTEQGVVGLCSLDAKSMRRTGGVSDRQNRPGVGSGASSRRPRVCCLHTADVVKSGALDLLVGRDDGTLELWNLGDAAAFASQRLEQAPTPLWETCLQESIQSLSSGHITGGDYMEVILATYSGKVLAFTPSGAARDPTGTQMAKQEEREEAGASVMSRMVKGTKSSDLEQAEMKQERSRRFQALEQEVARLKAETDKARKDYQNLSSEQIAMQTTTKVSHRFGLTSEEACYILTLESQAAIELIALRADVEVDLLDHSGTSAILSRSRGDPQNPLLAYYRMQEEGSRFQIRMRTVEGLSGTLSAFVVPETQPKTAHLITVSIKPLALHVNEETFGRFLELVHPKLNYQHALTQQVRMVEPLREVQLQEGETKFLHPELQSVLDQAHEIQQQFELQPQKLAFLHNMVISAYRHKWRLRGYQSVDHRIKDLQKLLESYNLESVSAFFSESID
ncbi:Bardet-Biedl syndrome 7 protein (BBS2-like protein 1) [Durusdinium trenchii]|uniref:Bardet-Biedl syndrome 7 protein (BBS2-like protein 1) n=1 Tax=Durusdinium trenchii TaxID=1381693 RepID=A0ABP0PXG7_9DINO